MGDNEAATLEKLKQARKVLARLRAHARLTTYLGEAPAILAADLKAETNRLVPNSIPADGVAT